MTNVFLYRKIREKVIFYQKNKEKRYILSEKQRETIHFIRKPNSQYSYDGRYFPVSQRHFLRQLLPNDIFPNDNFFRRQLSQAVLAAAFAPPPIMTEPSLKCTFGKLQLRKLALGRLQLREFLLDKLPLRKLSIVELQLMEIVTWEVAT